MTRLDAATAELERSARAFVAAVLIADPLMLTVTRRDLRAAAREYAVAERDVLQPVGEPRPDRIDLEGA